MAGNSQRRNRRTTNKKGATVGSGGQRRKGLEGKGPTPPAEARKGHKKNRVANAQARRVSGQSRRPSGRGAKSTSEMVVGRNPVVEALRADIPATAVYVQQFIDSDDRVREALRLATDRGVPLLEAPRPELDRITAGLNHQGLVLQIPPYEYAHPDDLLAEASEQRDEPLIVALDGVTDPRNLGAVVRSVAAFGGHGVVVPERRAAGMTMRRLEDLGRHCGPRPGGPRHQPDPHAGGVPEGRPDRHRPGRRRRRRPLRPRSAHRPRRHRRGQRGQGPVATGRRDLRPAGPHPDAGRCRGVPEQPAWRRAWSSTRRRGAGPERSPQAVRAHHTASVRLTRLGHRGLCQAVS